MDHEAFEREYLALLDKHDVPQAVLIYRKGTSLCLRAAGNNPIDDAGAEALGLLVLKLLADPTTSETVSAAIVKAAKEHPP